MSHLTTPEPGVDINTRNCNPHVENDNLGVEMEDIQPRGPKYKIKKLGYIWLSYFSIITLIIMFTPNAIINSSTVTSFSESVTSPTPYVHYLAGLSHAPNKIKFAYCVVLLSSIGHGVILISIVFYNYLSGLSNEIALLKAAKFTWIFPLIIFITYFTCAACKARPGRFDYIAISSSFTIAFLGQGGISLAMLSMGGGVLSLLIKCKLLKVKPSS